MYVHDYAFVASKVNPLDIETPGSNAIAEL
jgi:hypothetical protein